jgi:hypothetical protein
MDVNDIKNQVLVRLGAGTSLGFYTDTILTDWFTLAHKWATSYKKWTYTEGRVSTTYSTSTEEWSYPEGWKPDSIRMLQVGGKRCQKLNFEDYQRFREDNPDSTDKVFSDYGTVYYINPNAGLSGTTVVYGQYTPIWDITDEDFKTVFSGVEEDGNEAIIQRMLAFAMEKEKKTQEAIVYYAKAKELLDRMWQNYKDEQFGYHTKNRGIWSDFDVLEGGVSDTNEDQF